ncbi:MAG: hypothetical protein HQL76_10140 [Magnetococcales bacterium]|nr:hypothetical protein [Magnetococcales bacterium]
MEKKTVHRIAVSLATVMAWLVLIVGLESHAQGASVLATEPRGGELEPFGTKRSPGDIGSGGDFSREVEPDDVPMPSVNGFTLEGGGPVHEFDPEDGGGILDRPPVVTPSPHDFNIPAPIH